MWSGGGKPTLSIREFPLGGRLLKGGSFSKIAEPMRVCGTGKAWHKINCELALKYCVFFEAAGKQCQPKKHHTPEGIISQVLSRCQPS